ncbi:MAG: FtsX-like permease family protein, partial [Chitinophagaceae bacterium]
LIEIMQKNWKEYKVSAPLVYSFLDESIIQTYQPEKKAGRILGVFAGLTIFVACLGVFGLAMLTAEQRTKKIGVRKVLGASVAGIVSLLSKDFLILVSVACLIASPVEWIIMSKWLQDFAYRINISLWIFIVAALVAIILTVITVGF